MRNQVMAGNREPVIDKGGIDGLKKAQIPNLMKSDIIETRLRDNRTYLNLTLSDLLLTYIIVRRVLVPSEQTRETIIMVVVRLKRFLE